MSIMQEQIRITLYLDNRRKKIDGLYPVKLRLYQPRYRKERLYRIGFDLSQSEFDQGYLKLKPTNNKNRLSRQEKEDLELKILKLEAVKSKGRAILDNLNEFSFVEFEKRFYNKFSKLDVVDYYGEYIQKLKEEERLRTADSYFYSLKKLLEFFNEITKKPIKQIPFEAVTVSKLKAFENYCLRKGHSNASIGFYLRPLRSIFNYAIADPNSGVKKESYPFGARKYTIPTGQNIKKALTNDQLKMLFELEPINEYQKKAKAFWFFSYLANGMNFKDIAELRFKNLHGKRLSFYRSKTKITSKSQPILISAILPNYAIEIVEQYGNDPKIDSDFIFPIIEKRDNAEIANRKITSFIRFTNQHIKNMVKHYNEIKSNSNNSGIEKSEFIPKEISTYWARHSFTTQAMRKGASMELLQESLGHKSLATTQNYFAGFTSEVKEELSRSLLDF